MEVMTLKNKRIIDYIAKTAIFSALSFILYLFPKFPLPFFPSFLDIQFSNLPAILGGFVLGPLGGCIIVIVRCLLKLILGMSSTAGAGELADLLLGIAVVFTSSMIYKHYKNKRGGIVALIVAIIVWVVSSIFINCYINIPVYLELFYKGDIEGLVATCKLVIKGINADNFMEYYIKYAVIPFNFILATLVSLITFIVYKRISLIFKKDFFSAGKTKVLVICDSFKGTLSSKEVGEIIVENINKNKEYSVTSTYDISYKAALIIGVFQLIAAIFPGTSRSGATIIGALIIGISRTAAAEFTFFLGIPVMFGASLLKIVKFLLEGNSMTSNEWIIMIVGFVIAYLVSVFAIKGLMSYVKKHDFKVFGWYRIILAIAILCYFGFVAKQSLI
jgi:undecaprenyl-diphosphatase UppP